MTMTCQEQIINLRDNLDERIGELDREAVKRQIERNCLLQMIVDLDRILDSTPSEETPVEQPTARRPIQKTIFSILANQGASQAAIEDYVKRHAGADRHAVDRTLARMVATGKINLRDDLYWRPTAEQSQAA